MKDAVIKTFCRIMNVPEGQVNEASSPETVENWDSIRHMGLILALEEDFGVHFNDTQVTELLSVGAIIKTIADLKK